ncbi:MAG: hypothetical protein IK038_09610 [Bacteroidaceae bacterium]|nr:hypothetical protein [Bacteroidaceae bacterium]
MKQTNKLKMIAAMAVSVLSFTITGCSSDDFYGFDYDEDNNIAPWNDGAERINTTDYLTISSDCTDKWTENDYKAFSLAVERIGISYSKKKQVYEFHSKSAKDINISDSLYNIVITMFEHTNKIFRSSNNKKFKNTKSRFGEISFSIPDCVPCAIAWMGQNAPTYSTVVARCNELFPNWLQNGGIPGDAVFSLISEYASVYYCTDMSFCNATENSLNNIVTLFIWGHLGHAVNAYKCTKYGSVLIYYHDHSSSSQGDGVMFESEMVSIYPFVQN